jgi:hypothetical protein
VGKVADVIGGFGQVLNPLGLYGLARKAKDGNASCHEQREDGGICAAKDFHRFLLYGTCGAAAARYSLAMASG